MSDDTTYKAPPFWLAGLIFAAFPTFFTVKFGPMLDPDVYDYIGFWRKLMEGFPHTDRDDALPKALPVLLNGSVYSLTQSFYALSAVSIAAGAAAVAVLSRCIAKVAGPVAGWISVAILSCLPPLVRQATEGGSDVLELLFIALALRELSGRNIRWVRTSVFLLFAGLCRPELWPLFAMGGLASIFIVRKDKQKAFALALPCAAPILWMSFDALLTGDFFFAFSNTATYSQRAVDSVERIPLLASVPAFGWDVTRTVLGLLTGLGVGLGVWGFIRLAKVDRRLCLSCIAICVSVTAMYFPPFLQGVPILGRFLVVPVTILAAISSLALAKLWDSIRTEPASILRQFGAPLFLAAALLPLVQGVAQYGKHVAPQFSNFVSELDVALDWIVSNDPQARDRKYFCTPRRRYQIILDLDCPSDNVIHHRRFDPATFGSDAREQLDYILVDPMDTNDGLRALWDAVELPPPGFERVSLPDSVHRLQGYRRTGL